MAHTLDQMLHSSSVFGERWNLLPEKRISSAMFWVFHESPVTDHESRLFRSRYIFYIFTSVKGTGLGAGLANATFHQACWNR